MIKKTIFFALILTIISCNEKPENIRGIPTNAAVEAEKLSIEEEAERLNKGGYQTFTQQQGDSTYLLQQYYVAFLKKGSNRQQDSLEALKLQEEHLAHLTRLYKEGYTSLTGPMGDEGEIRGLIVFNTASQKEADSLARLDPMVKAGRLEVEVRPWWTAKGGKLN